MQIKDRHSFYLEMTSLSYWIYEHQHSFEITYLHLNYVVQPVGNGVNGAKIYEKKKEK